MDDLSFSIITPAYNNAEEVKKLLDSVREEVLKDRTLEVIVIDDCSREYFVRDVTEKSGFARYIRLESNSGPSTARNIGAKNAKNAILIFVDSDVVFNSDTISKVRDVFNKNKTIEVFGGEYDIVPANPSIATKFKSIMGRSWCPTGGVTTVFLARFGAIKKRVFDELGGFNADLKTAAVEDYELGRRLTDKGYTIYYDPTVTVKHHFPAFKKQVKLFFDRAFMWVYILKHYKRFDNICTTPALGLTQVCGFASVSLFIASLIKPVFICPALSMLVVFILMNMRFFKLTMKNEGAIFTLLAVPMALIVASSITFGTFFGMVNFFILRKNA